MPLLDRECACGYRENDILEHPIQTCSIICPACGEPTFRPIPCSGNFHIDGGTCKAMDWWDNENDKCQGSYGNSYTKLDLRDRKMASHPVYSK